MQKSTPGANTSRAVPLDRFGSRIVEPGRRDDSFPSRVPSIKTYRHLAIGGDHHQQQPSVHVFGASPEFRVDHHVEGALHQGSFTLSRLIMTAPTVSETSIVECKSIFIVFSFPSIRQPVKLEVAESTSSQMWRAHGKVAND